jgi:hypothetical protein
MMEALQTSEMLVYFNETKRRYIPEGYHILHRENMKSHTKFWLESLKGRDKSENLDVDGMIILK